MGARRGWFYRVRVALLTSILAIVLVYAWRDRRARLARNTWESPLRVGLVFLRLGNVDETALERMMERSSALEARLQSELNRYRPEVPAGAIQILQYGPVNVNHAPPTTGRDTYWDRARMAYELWIYTRIIDQEAGVRSRDLDSRIYVVTEPSTGKTNFVDGFGQAGGRIGVAHVGLGPNMVDYGLFVAAHELLHTLGATDKYDSEGNALIPDGLADPEQRPLFPQPGAEVMAGTRVLSTSLEAAPDSLQDLWVGPKTAREIGWTSEQRP